MMWWWCDDDMMMMWWRCYDVHVYITDVHVGELIRIAYQFTYMHIYAFVYIYAHIRIHIHSMAYHPHTHAYTSMHIYAFIYIACHMHTRPCTLHVTWCAPTYICSRSIWYFVFGMILWYAMYMNVYVCVHVMMMWYATATDVCICVYVMMLCALSWGVMHWMSHHACMWWWCDVSCMMMWYAMWTCICVCMWWRYARRGVIGHVHECARVYVCDDDVIRHVDVHMCVYVMISCTWNGC